MTKAISWRPLLAAATAAWLGLSPAQAQDAAALLPGGANSLREVHGDWVVNCAIVTQQQQARKVCTLSQEQQDGRNNQRVIAIELVPAAKAATGTLALPFGLALASGVILQIDDRPQTAPLPFRTCLPAGCIVSLSISAEMLDGLRTGTALKVHVVADGGQKTAISVSLKGFGNAFDRTKVLAGP